MSKRGKKKLEPEVLRVPVNFNYTGLNWDFIKLMSEIPPYADEKYGSWAQYAKARMEGEKSPINHLIEHARQYAAGEPYDKFDGDVGRHLAAIAYNAMIEFFYLKKFGWKAHPLALPVDRARNKNVAFTAVYGIDGETMLREARRAFTGKIDAEFESVKPRRRKRAKR